MTAPTSRRPTTPAVTVVSGGFLPARGLRTWLERTLPRRVRGSFTIKFVSDREMARLNGEFRGKPVPTDVLSFPAEGEVPRGASRSRAERPRKGAEKLPSSNDLGDIAIATGVARRQALELGHPVATEVKVLALHGVLHLLGYDHERDRGEMRAVEERWRRRAGLPAGLVSRADRPPRPMTR